MPTVDIKARIVNKSEFVIIPPQCALPACPVSLNDMWRELTRYPAGNLQKTVYTALIFGGFHNFENTFRERIHCFLRQVAEDVAPEDIDGSAADG